MKRLRFILPVLILLARAWAATGELRFCLASDPKTFDPLRVTDESSEAVRYMTGGVLIRLNRSTQELSPELALSWKIRQGGRSISFKLRQGVRFSDGTPFTAEDVAYTFRRLMDPNLHSPVADPFRSAAGPVLAQVAAADEITLTFPAPVSGLERLFDQVSILSSRSPAKDKAVLGPFYVADYKPGSELLLKRNLNYWKRDAQGRRLPYAEALRVSIQQNREIQVLRFRRGELDLVNNLPPDLFDRLARQMPSATRDLGAGLESEMMWFNQVSKSPVPAYKMAWFRSANFRRAISAAINREDLCRVVYLGHARPAEGPVSPANKFWFNARLKPHAHDPAGALQRLRQDGFRLEGGVLRDREGHPVEFSVITNAGNRSRERMAAMIQQDLAAIGIRLHPVTLDFASLLERITRSFDYEACLLGLTNLDLDPSAQMNVWLSSANNHQWSPNQKAPETAWEAEIDRLMRAQASALQPERRKASFDRVQEIVSEQAPFLYLVTRNALVAVSPALLNVRPTVIAPQTLWNVESLTEVPQLAQNR